MARESDSQIAIEPKPQEAQNAPEAINQQMPAADHVVTLTVDTNGNFTYSPTLLRADQGETIRFQCVGHWEIMFKEKSPGDRLFLWHDDSLLTIREDAEYAVYHYAAAVNRGDRVFLDSACGDIAVGR
jgi:hypothetical protein